MTRQIIANKSMTRNKRTELKQTNRENILKVLMFDNQTNNVEINIKIQQQCTFF